MLQEQLDLNNYLFEGAAYGLKLSGINRRMKPFNIERREKRGDLN